MTLNKIYNDLIAATLVAAEQNENLLVTSAISKLNMKKCKPEDYKFTQHDNAYQVLLCDERVFIQYRWYDNSKVFSIQPDMNVYLIRHSKAGKTISEKQIKFEDKF